MGKRRTGRIPRDSLESKGNSRSAKTITNGFGVVRFLTQESQKQLSHDLHEGGITPKRLYRKDPAHATVIKFMGMNRREQAAFDAGFNVSRLEERLEYGDREQNPPVDRRALTVVLGNVASINNFIYCEVEDVRLIDEQNQLAGAVAMRGINISRINKRIIAPHVGLGHNQNGPLNETIEMIESAVPGSSVALQRWEVYPNRYS